MSEIDVKYPYKNLPIKARIYGGGADDGELISGEGKLFEFLDPDTTPASPPSGGPISSTENRPVMVSGGYLDNRSGNRLSVVLFKSAEAAAGYTFDEANTHLFVPAGSADSPAKVEWTGIVRAIWVENEGAGTSVYAAASRDLLIMGLK